MKVCLVVCEGTGGEEKSTDKRENEGEGGEIGKEVSQIREL